jgi:hypothetical protein
MIIIITIIIIIIFIITMIIIIIIIISIIIIGIHTTSSLRLRSSLVSIQAFFSASHCTQVLYCARSKEEHSSKLIHPHLSCINFIDDLIQHYNTSHPVVGLF